MAEPCLDCLGIDANRTETSRIKRVRFSEVADVVKVSQATLYRVLADL